MTRLALPSKGEMEEPTLDFLASCGFAVDRPNQRQYSATVPSLPGVEILFQRSADIAAKVEEGSADLGITGFDTFRETAREGGAALLLYEDLGYSRCELVLAVPEAWVDVNCLADIVDLSIEFRERGRELRVATKYPRLTRQFLFERGLTHFGVVGSTGAMEAAPTMGYADIIADLTASGVTLRENHLKLIEGGTILRSAACLIGNGRALGRDRAALNLAQLLLEQVEARLRGGGRVALTANLHAASPEEAAQRVLSDPALAGLHGPTVAPVYGKESATADAFAVTVVLDRGAVMRAVQHLRQAGASSISVVPIHSLFEGECAAFQRLRRNLQ